MFSLPFQMNDVAAILRQVAKDILLPAFHDPELRKERIKPDGTPVTLADEACEEALTKHLAKLLPQSKFLGEETFSSNPSAIHALNGPDNVWIIDPIDGTKRFKTGKETSWGILLSFIRQGKLAASWIYLPSHAEGGHEGQMIMAQAGAGTTLNGQPVSLIDTNFDLKNIPGYHNVKWLKEDIFWPVNSQIQQHQAMESDPSSAWSFYCLLKGHKKVYLHTAITPWDTSAGVLATQEAGGVSRPINGGEYNVTSVQNTLLHATTEDIWEQVRQTFFKKEDWESGKPISLPRLDTETGQAYSQPKYKP